PRDWFLFAGSVARLDRRPSGQGISQFLGGMGGNSSLPLLPRFDDPGNMNPRLRRLGYSAHTLRHFAHQNIRQAAQERLEATGERRVSGQSVADAVLDHNVREDT